MTSWQNAQIDKMTIWQNDSLTKWLVTNIDVKQIKYVILEFI